MEKFGNFLEEVAVLVFVFVPLDYWRGKVDSLQIFTVVFVAGGSFTLGLACHWGLRCLKEGQKG